MPSLGPEVASLSIGAESRDLSDLNTRPHSHYLVRQFDGVDLWGSAAKVQVQNQ